MTPTSSPSALGSKRYRPTSRYGRHEVVAIVHLEVLYRRHAAWLAAVKREGLVLPLLESVLLEYSLASGAAAGELKEAWVRAHCLPEMAGAFTAEAEAFCQALFQEIDRIWQSPAYQLEQRAVYSAMRRGYHGPDLLIEIAYRDTSPS